MGFKFTAGVLVGIAAGAVIMHYLETEEGKEFVRKIRQDLGEMGERFTEMAEDILASGRSFVEQTEQETQA